MKTFELKTGKGDFVLVDMPDKDFEGDTLPGLPKLGAVRYIGHLKTLTEEQAAEIVERREENLYIGFAKKEESPFFCLGSAKYALNKSLESLGIHLYENPFPSEWAVDRFNEWQQAEEKTFYNPIILKRI